MLFAASNFNGLFTLKVSLQQLTVQQTFSAEAAIWNREKFSQKLSGLQLVEEWNFVNLKMHPLLGGCRNLSVQLGKLSSQIFLLLLQKNGNLYTWRWWICSGNAPLIYELYMCWGFACSSVCDSIGVERLSVWMSILEVRVGCVRCAAHWQTQSAGCRLVAAGSVWVPILHERTWCFIWKTPVPSRPETRSRWFICQLNCQGRLFQKKCVFYVIFIALT